MASAANKSNISGNKRKIFELENEVLGNKSNGYLTRGYVIENRDLILRNYKAAFQGNRQLANSNTEAAFRNRQAIVKNLAVGEDAVKTNYREALSNRVKLEFLEHRSKLNEQVNGVSEELIAVNARLIEVNKNIMKINEEIVKYNSGLIDDNKKWLDAGVEGLAKATPDSNAKLIAENSAKVDEISKRAKVNAEKNEKNYATSQANREKLENNSKKIYDRRAQILANKKLVHDNADRIAKQSFA